MSSSECEGSLTVRMSDDLSAGDRRYENDFWGELSLHGNCKFALRDVFGVSTVFLTLQFRILDF